MEDRCTTFNDDVMTPQTTQVPQEANVQRLKPRLLHVEKFDGSNLALYPQFKGLLRVKLEVDGPAIRNIEEQAWYGFRRLTGEAACQIYPWIALVKARGNLTTKTLFNQLKVTFSDP